MKPLNIKHKKIFGYIPRITDYSCSREEYLNAMKEAIESKKPLSVILIRHESRYKTILELQGI